MHRFQTGNQAYLGCKVGFAMKYDVVVVGAGPAGSTAAKCLAEKGINVLLIDKSKFPRDKTCGGGLPTRVWKRFPYIEELIDSVSYGSITHSSSLKYKFEFIRDKPLIVTVLRNEFDNGLVKIAVEKGATFFDGKQVTDIMIYDDKTTIQLDDRKKIEAQVVIGCDGIKSIVAEKSGFSQKDSKKCIGLLQEKSMTAKQLDTFFTEKRLVHLFIKTQGIAGYGWIFPKKKHINIGMGVFESVLDPSKPKINLKESYKKYIQLLKEKKILPNDFVVDNLTGGTLPVFPLKKTYSNRILLCGDAAGFINPITGEGIYYAMTSGEIAASVVAEALNVGDTSEKYLSNYQTFWKNDFGKDLKILGRFNNRWGTSSEKLVRFLSKDEKLAKLIVGVTGGQLSISKYRIKLLLRYIYVSLKDLFSKNEKN